MKSCGQCIYVSFFGCWHDNNDVAEHQTELYVNLATGFVGKMDDRGTFLYPFVYEKIEGAEGACECGEWLEWDYHKEIYACHTCGRLYYELEQDKGEIKKFKGKYPKQA